MLVPEQTKSSELLWWPAVLGGNDAGGGSEPAVALVIMPEVEGALCTLFALSHIQVDGLLAALKIPADPRTLIVTHCEGGTRVIVLTCTFVSLATFGAVLCVCAVHLENLVIGLPRCLLIASSHQVATAHAFHVWISLFWPVLVGSQGGKDEKTRCLRSCVG